MEVGPWKFPCSTFINKRGNRSNSANYRSIVLGSLCCKMFVNTVLKNHQYNLTSGQLLFRYKMDIDCDVLYTVMYYF